MRHDFVTTGKPVTLSSTQKGITVTVGNKNLAAILNKELAALRDPEQGGEATFSIRDLARLMDVDHNTLSRAIRGHKVNTSGFNIGKIALYFRKKYGVAKQMEVLKATEIYLED